MRLVSERRAATESLLAILSGGLFAAAFTTGHGWLAAMGLFSMLGWMAASSGAPAPGDPRYVVVCSVPAPDVIPAIRGEVRVDGGEPVEGKLWRQLHYGPFMSYESALECAERVEGSVQGLIDPVWR